MKKRMLLASTVALSFAPVLATQAEEVLWTARSVEQIQNDLTKTDNKTSYTVQYGDTLSTIAEALGVDVTVLANLNKITNMDLIFPETVLTTTVNEAEEVTEVEIQTPQADSSEEVTTATADLTTNQVTVDDQTVQVADLSQPIAEVTKTVIASEEVAPSTGISVPEEQTTETTRPVEEATPQETTPAEKQETQCISSGSNYNKFRSKRSSIIKWSYSSSFYLSTRRDENNFNNLRGSSCARLCWTCSSKI